MRDWIGIKVNGYEILFASPMGRIELSEVELEQIVMSTFDGIFEGKIYNSYGRLAIEWKMGGIAIQASKDELISYDADLDLFGIRTPDKKVAYYDTDSVHNYYMIDHDLLNKYKKRLTIE